MDFITGLTLCANGCNAIFTCVDYLTKYTVLTAGTLGVGELSTKQVAELFFQGVVIQFGLPENMVHGRDPRFTVEFWTEFWHNLGSGAIFSSAQHPLTDGQKERQHRT